MDMKGVLTQNYVAFKMSEMEMIARSMNLKKKKRTLQLDTMIHPLPTPERVYIIYSPSRCFEWNVPTFVGTGSIPFASAPAVHHGETCFLECLSISPNLINCYAFKNSSPKSSRLQNWMLKRSSPPQGLSIGITVQHSSSVYIMLLIR